MASNPSNAVSNGLLKLKDEPPIFVAVIYHSRKGDIFSRMLASLEKLDYPKNRLFLCFIDNYSSDGAFELCSDWISRFGEKYMGVIHLKVRGNPSRLRNVALRIAFEKGFEWFCFIESDVMIDEEFLRRELDVFRSFGDMRSLLSVSAVWDVGYENLDWLERKNARWLKARIPRFEEGVRKGEACNTSACLINLILAKKVGFFDEDIYFIEDLDWGRRATRMGYDCLFDSRVVIKHLRRYSLKEFKKYFMKGALSEAKLFLKNRIAVKVLRSVVYWDALIGSLLLTWFSPLPFLLFISAGFVAYFRRCVGLGRFVLFFLHLPFRAAKSLALSLAMLWWLIHGGYDSERVSVINGADWEVVFERG